MKSRRVPRKFNIEELEEGGNWTYLEHDAGVRPKEPVSIPNLVKTLKWVVQQLDLGWFAVGEDGEEDMSLVLGRRVAVDYRASEATVLKFANDRWDAVVYSGVVAEARESGWSRKAADIYDDVSNQLTPQNRAAIRMNAGFHYAYELVDALERTVKRSLALEILPVSENAPMEVRRYMKEATRAYLYGLDRASVALCRACVEAALRAKLSALGMMENEAPLELEQMISRASRSPLRLGGPLIMAAHEVRLHGNAVMHFRRDSEVKAKEMVDRMRTVVDGLFGQR